MAFIDVKKKHEVGLCIRKAETNERVMYTMYTSFFFKYWTCSEYTGIHVFKSKPLQFKLTRLLMK